MNIPNTLKHPIVRDLYWLLTSPSLYDFKQKSTEFSVPTLSWFEYWQQHVQQVDAFFAEVNFYMIGPYYEALWRFYLKNSATVRLLRSNVQINSNKKTLGELDFICHSSTQLGLLHLEVAIKFYLYVPESGLAEDLSSWWGPKCNDRFDLKVKKMDYKQSEMLQRSQTQATLLQWYSSSQVSKAYNQSILQGRLYLPFAMSLQQKQNKLRFATEQAYWLVWPDFVQKFSQIVSDYRLFMQEKPHWLAYVCQDTMRLHSLSQAQQYFQCHKQVLHLYVCELGKEEGGFWLMVLRQGWLELREAKSDD